MNRYIKKIFILLIAIAFISVPLLKAGTYDIKSFGAVGDGKTINTQAIQKAIDKCRDNGGGTVLVPQGTFISGTIQLFSNIDLHIERGAIFKGSDKVSDYYLNNKKVGLIYTENSENISITGEGDIDGNGDSFMDVNHSKVMDTASIRFTRQKNHFREVTSGLGDGPLVPADDRPNQMVIFSNCRNVTIRNTVFSNAAFWTIHLADCDGAIVYGVRIWNNLMVPNNDGIDFTSCSNIQMSDCDIRTGDDGIVVVGYSHHFDTPGFNNILHDSKNVTITNCTIVSRSSGIRIGGWDQNYMRNYTFNNIVITNSNRGINLCVRDSASIEDMTFSNIIIETRLHTGDWWGNGEPIHLSVIRGKEKTPVGHISNIKFESIIAKSEAGILLYSSKEGKIENITFRDMTLYIKDSPKNATCGGNFDLRPALDPKFTLFSHDIPAFYAENVQNIQLHNVEIKWDNVNEQYFTNGLEFNGFENVLIDGCRINPSPSGKNLAAISMENGKKFNIINSYTDNPGTRLLDKKNVK
jgi:polygalacturonase